MKQLQKIIIPALALIIGLILGFGIGHLQVKKEKKLSKERMEEANRKIVFMQKKMAEIKTEADTASEQKCQGDMEKLDALQREKKMLDLQAGKLKEQIQGFEAKLKASDEAAANAKEVLARTKKESTEAAAKAAEQLKDAEQKNRELDGDLKRMSGEKQALQTELTKTGHSLDKCKAHNAELCIIAEELVKKYKDKGLGAVIAGKEPLTQLKKVELEKLAQQYREGIEQLKIRKK
jgi:chromosome segregation ATPase